MTEIFRPVRAASYRGERVNDEVGARISLGDPLNLPCGLLLKNRIAKAAMSDSLGDGRGDATEAQARLYARWARGSGASAQVLSRSAVEARPGARVRASLDSDPSTISRASGRHLPARVEAFLALARAEGEGGGV